VSLRVLGGEKFKNLVFVQKLCFQRLNEEKRQKHLKNFEKI
jgi:hypothetical protein